LYNSIAAALITDFGLLAAGIAVYLSSTRARARTETWAFWLLMLFIVLLAALAAVPPLALPATICMALLLPIGNWVDRHRAMKVAGVQQVA
jgi:hypothetical protein